MNTAVSAIRCDGDQRIAISVPEGSIVTLKLAEEEFPTGLVEVTWDAKPFLMFAVDLRERAERLRMRKAGKSS